MCSWHSFIAPDSTAWRGTAGAVYIVHTVGDLSQAECARRKVRRHSCRNVAVDARRAQGIGFAALMGAAAGAALAAHRGPSGALKGALLGAGALAAVDAVARSRQ